MSIFTKPTKHHLQLRRCMHCNRVHGYYLGIRVFNLKTPVPGHFAGIPTSLGICPLCVPAAMAAANQLQPALISA